MINPARLRSLLELLRIYASQYVRIGQMIEQYRTAAASANPNEVPNQEQYSTFIGMLQTLRSICAQIRLPVSVTMLDKTIAEFSAAVPYQHLAHQRMNEWFSCFTSELESRLFMLVLPHRVDYWHAQVWDGSPFYGEEIDGLLQTLGGGFRDAFYDATEAGQCFAYALFTACVYHLMRVTEYGLVSVARAANVPEEKIAKGWDGCIQGIESEIKTIGSTKPTRWQEETKKYSDLCAWLTTIKNGWRNPVSHIPRTYSEDTARAMFSAVRTLFEHLRRHGFVQSTMPRDQIMPPTDSGQETP